MKYLAQNWQQRTIIIVLISLIFSGLMWTIEFSSWAESINNSAMMTESHSDEKSAPFIFMLVMSFVKLLVLTLVPFTVTYGLVALVNKVSKSQKRSAKTMHTQRNR